MKKCLVLMGIYIYIYINQLSIGAKVPNLLDRAHEFRIIPYLYFVSGITEV